MAFRENGDKVKKRRGERRGANRTIPRSALRAGVGVFILAVAFWACDSGPTEPDLRPSGGAFLGDE
jgi:hypothetical protein